jgi:hypothetical protein
MFKKYKEMYKDNEIFLDFVDKIESTFDADIFKDNIARIDVFYINPDNVIKNNDKYEDGLFYSIGIHLNNNRYLFINLYKNKIYNIAGQRSLEYFHTDNWDEMKDFIYKLKKDFIFIPSDNYYIGDNDSIIITKEGISVKRDDIIYDFDYYSIDCTWKLDDLLSLIRHNRD